jgi:hypothetical protein
MRNCRGKRRGRERVRVKGLRISAFYNGCKSRIYKGALFIERLNTHKRAEFYT